jgi:hypothetical protein
MCIRDRTLKYKTVHPSGSSFGMEIKNMDTPNSVATVTPLSASSSWTTAEVFLEENVTYRIGLFAKTPESADAILFVDDIVFEEDVNEPVIVGYTESAQPYYDFTYIKKGHFDGSGTQQITLPDYFKGLNFDVIVTPTGDFKWGGLSSSSYLGTTYWSFNESSIMVLSVNNTVPSFTVQYSSGVSSSTPADFVYTVILNS